MSEKEVNLTKQGLKKLEAELEFLKTVKRPEIAARLKEATGHGDLSENFEYEEAKNDQAFNEGRITSLENKLKNARIIRSFEITVKDLESGETAEYTIVGTDEADPDFNQISNESPVGKALNNKQKGDLIEVTVPMGNVRYEVLDSKVGE
jgi:transcription elongation factor GreA